MTVASKNQARRQQQQQQQQKGVALAVVDIVISGAHLALARPY